VWLAVYVAREMLTFYLEGSRRGGSYALPIALAISIFAVLFVVALWFFPRTIARGLLSSSSADATPAASADMWLAMGCALIGLWLLSSALPALIRNLVFLYLSRSGEVDTTNLRYGLFYYFVELLMAVWLILGANGFRRIFWWARNAGQS
jgi:hypothetical protein